MAPSHVGFRDHVDAERHGTLFEAHDAGQRSSSDVIEARTAAGGNVPHLVSETSLSHEGRGVTAAHDGVAAGFSTGVEHLNRAQGKVGVLKDARRTVENDGPGLLDGGGEVEDGGDTVSQNEASMGKSLSGMSTRFPSMLAARSTGR